MDEPVPGNIFAFVVLFLWVPTVIVMFFAMKPHVACAIAVFMGLLLLPEKTAIRVPGMPAFGKIELTYLGILLGTLITRPRSFRNSTPKKWPRILWGLLFLGTVVTVFTNMDPVGHGVARVPGLTTADIRHDVMTLFLVGFAPFLVGRALYRSPEQLRFLLKVMAMAMLIYLPFIILELRLSPQLHRWIYGFHQHSFIQTLRDGGFRPMVFASHGLALAKFLMVGVLAAVAVGSERFAGKHWYGIAFLLFLVLVLVKSLGALLLCVLGLGLLLLGSVRARLRAATFFSLLVFIVPALRASDAVPTDELVDLVKSFKGEDRAQSLEFRFRNEDMLVEKALERPLFGWGRSHKRNRVLDAESGKDISVTDGEWIIVLGTIGIFGFIARMGLFLMPVFGAWKKVRLLPRPSRRLYAAGALIHGLLVVDLIPNAALGLPMFFLLGALCGSLAGAVRERKRHSMAPLAVAQPAR
jgi:hypothetical protein